ncbi:unnamed protein product [Thelazia callipaeda]|uniref:BAR domain-containing protein n=1 Tax=Thelazia callipaeda TaxID=103827 RepID=A0A0N5D224_THECL|nr:unnamed protein product [Thelazia callipaeda]
MINLAKILFKLCFYFQKRLSEEVEAIDVRENACRKGRQQLIAENKKFYESVDKQTRKAVSPLIKSFQIEYDRVTDRAKAAESCVIVSCRAITSACVEVQDRGVVSIAPCVIHLEMFEQFRKRDGNFMLGNRDIGNRMNANALQDCRHPSQYLERIPLLLRELGRLHSVDEQVGNLTKQVHELREEYADLQNQGSSFFNSTISGKIFLASDEKFEKTAHVLNLIFCKLH